MLNLVINDIKRFFSGFFALLRYIFEREEISLSLSLFSTDSQNSQIGKTSAYELTLANNSNDDLWARVLFDIYRKDTPSHPDGHVAYFVKKVFIRSNESKTLSIQYNWQDNARFEIDGVSQEADAAWLGSSELSGLCNINAVLLNESGNSLETLTIIQNLTK